MPYGERQWDVCTHTHMRVRAHTHGTLYSSHTKTRRRRAYIVSIYKVAADEIRTAFQSGTRRRRRLPCEFWPRSPRNDAPGRTGLRAPTLLCRHIRVPIYIIYIYNIIILHSLQTSISRSNRRQRSHVPNIEPSASENGSDPEQPQQRQQQFLR